MRGAHVVSVSSALSGLPGAVRVMVASRRSVADFYVSHVIASCDCLMRLRWACQRHLLSSCEGASQRPGGDMRKTVVGAVCSNFRWFGRA